MTATAQFIDATNKVYLLVVGAEESKGIDEFVLNTQIEQLKEQYQDINIKDALECLIDEGDVIVNCPEDSFICYYQAKKKSI